MSLTSLQAQTAEFVLKNETSVWLRLYVDGNESCSAPPGDRCVDLVTPGQHSVRAETIEPNPRSVSNVFNMPIEGFTWTITA